MISPLRVQARERVNFVHNRIERNAVVCYEHIDGKKRV